LLTNTCQRFRRAPADEAEGGTLRLPAAQPISWIKAALRDFEEFPEIVKTERRSPSVESVNVTITAQESLEEVRELESIATK
jgi:hypothetical protein